MLARKSTLWSTTRRFEASTPYVWECDVSKREIIRPKNIHETITWRLKLWWQATTRASKRQCAGCCVLRIGPQIGFSVLLPLGFQSFKAENVKNSIWKRSEEIYCPCHDLSSTVSFVPLRMTLLCSADPGKMFSDPSCFRFLYQLLLLAKHFIKEAGERARTLSDQTREELLYVQPMKY